MLQWHNVYSFSQKFHAKSDIGPIKGRHYFKRKEPGPLTSVRSLHQHGLGAGSESGPVHGLDDDRVGGGLLEAPHAVLHAIQGLEGEVGREGQDVVGEGQGLGGTVRDPLVADRESGQVAVPLVRRRRLHNETGKVLVAFKIKLYDTGFRNLKHKPF